MRIKPKSALVIAVSSFVISCALILTIFGFYAYLEWNKKNLRKNYKHALRNLNGELFAANVIVDLEPKIARSGIFEGKPVVEGTIKNASNKKIYSLKLRIVFYDSGRRALYVDTFYPAGLGSDSAISQDGATENFLAEGDSVSFEHQLENCQPEVLNFLKSKLKFAKTHSREPLELTYKIEGLDIR